MAKWTCNREADRWQVEINMQFSSSGSGKLKKQCKLQVAEQFGSRWTCNGIRWTVASRSKFSIWFAGEAKTIYVELGNLLAACAWTMILCKGTLYVCNLVAHSGKDVRPRPFKVWRHLCAIPFGSWRPDGCLDVEFTYLTNCTNFLPWLLLCLIRITAVAMHVEIISLGLPRSLLDLETRW